MDPMSSTGEMVATGAHDAIIPSHAGADAAVEKMEAHFLMVFAALFTRVGMDQCSIFHVWQPCPHRRGQETFTVYDATDI
jgi:hypothetical protein